jgi:hypothetical protein
VKIFDKEIKPGTPVGSSFIARGLMRMARAWEKLAVHNGHVDWSNGMPTNVVESADAGGAPDTTGAVKYMVYQITADAVIGPPAVAPTAGFDWVRAHA